MRIGPAGWNNRRPGRFGALSDARLGRPTAPPEEDIMPAKSKAQQKAAGAALSAKRGETPKKDLKGAALLFASDAGAHITGQVLAVDGGYTAV